MVNVFTALKSFITPGNDDLGVEFCLAFQPIPGKHLGPCFNCAHNYGELSNSQKQAVISLSDEKKREDNRLIKNWRIISLFNVKGRSIFDVLAFTKPSGWSDIMVTINME